MASSVIEPGSGTAISLITTSLCFSPEANQDT